MGKKVSLLIVVFLMLLISFGFCEEVKKNIEVRRQYLENGKLVKEIKEVIQIIPPVEVVSTEGFKDGGSITVSLKDNSGKVFFFCLEAPNLTLPSDSAINRNRGIYVGARHYTLPGAKKIGQGTESEKIILRLLEDWVTKHIPERPSELSYEADRDLHYVNEIIKVLKSR